MDPPVLTSDLSSLLEIVLGDDVRLTVNAVGDNLMYQWQKDGTNIPGANSATYYIHGASWSDARGYRCVVSNVADTVVSNATYVTSKCHGWLHKYSKQCFS